MNPSAGKSCTFYPDHNELRADFDISLAPSFATRQLACVFCLYRKDEVLPGLKKDKIPFEFMLNITLQDFSYVLYIVIVCTSLHVQIIVSTFSLPKEEPGKDCIILGPIHSIDDTAMIQLLTYDLLAMPQK